MKRILGAVLLTGLLFTGAACGSSSGGSDGGDSGGGKTSSGNADVKAYCKAVDDYIQKVKDASNDAAGAQTLAKEGQELSSKAAALGTAGLSASDGQAVAECTKRSAEALTPTAGG